MRVIALAWFCGSLVACSGSNEPIAGSMNAGAGGASGEAGVGGSGGTGGSAGMSGVGGAGGAAGSANPCGKSGMDSDGDGVCDDVDNCIAAHNPSQIDSDGDGVGNACDPSNDDPCAGLGGDVDGDDVCTAHDNCPDVANAGQLDSDEDHIGDACDPNFDACHSMGGDSDGDGICDAVDNCVVISNSDQADSDGDLLGDACDPVNGVDFCGGKGGDDDHDNVCQAFDNCPSVVNPDQSDHDADGIGDACDPTPEKCDALGGDSDGDTVCDQVDNCPQASNLNQVDVDSDGVGDVCDPYVPVDPTNPPCAGLGGDADNDNYCSFYDNCPYVSNPTQSDNDGDGIGNACDVETCDGIDNDGNGQIDDGFADGDGDGVADCVDPCPSEPTIDSDHDGQLDCKDPCPYDALDDVDGDGVCGDVDNCPTVKSYTQSDVDGDGVGDACDVETCDGADNDGDGQIDEGLPDADGDKKCDLVDVCPNDPKNDVDGDGICGDVDKCPTVADVDQSDSDGDGWGDACDIDSPSACSTSATLNLPGQVALPPGLTMADMVANPVTGELYVSVKSTSSSHANEILALSTTAATPSILWALSVGSDPGPLAIAADGSILYVGLNGSSAVRMINPLTRKACLLYSLGNEWAYGALKAGDIAVLPSSPRSLLVSTRRPNVSPDFGGVYLFDSGVPRQKSTAGHTGAREIVVASDTRAYGYNSSSSEFGIRTLSIDAAGVTETSVASGLISSYSADIIYQGGKVFSTTGVVLNPTGPTVDATLPGASGPVAADMGFAEAYFAKSGAQIAVYDLGTYTLERNISIAGAGTPTKLVRWGANGLALLTTNSVYLTTGAGP